jgi:hypothetical protein
MSVKETRGDITYDAFISYSRKDEKFARKLEADLERYSPPKGTLPGRRRLNIFRDVQDLVGNDLSSAIREAVHSSKYLIVVCSPAARASRWVGREVDEFAKRRGKEFVIPVLVGGTPNNEVKPEDATQDQAFPEELCACLEEPLAADFRSVPDESRQQNRRKTREAKFQLIALLLAKPKEELLQRQRARTQRIMSAVVAAALLVAVGMGILALAAVNNAREARRQARVALSRQLAVQSRSMMSTNYDLSLLLAAAACSTARTTGALATII